MKKFIITIVSILLTIPMLVKAEEDLVKVYIFEAGGCPSCEAEIKYLKSLDSYEKKFTIVEKQLYVDHVDWKPGKDFNLGVKVALAFNNQGFTEAEYTATPFIVVSDVYAESHYNGTLEDIINEVYTKKDKDVVGCIEQNKDDCLEGYVDATYEAYAKQVYERMMGTTTNNSSSNNTYKTNTDAKEDNIIIILIVVIILAFSLIVGANIYLSKKYAVKSKKKK